MSNLPALQKRIPDVIAEYEQKFAAIPDVLEAFEAAGQKLKTSCVIGGTFGNMSFDTGRVAKHHMQRSLLTSAWQNLYDGLSIDRIASAKDRKLFEQTLASPPEFTLENIRATFGHYLLNPRDNILRGLAEVFAGLDPAYKSHEKVKIGVKGLPKRVILQGISEYGYGWGYDQMHDILRALSQYNQQSLPTRDGMMDLIKGAEYRGVWLKRFKNGNGHLFFGKDALLDINRALAEYYGNAIADDSFSDDEPAKKSESKEVAKDLQYYPTPQAVVETVLNNINGLLGARVLEPSCGCGRFLDELRKRGAIATGIEYDFNRAEQCKAKGHNVLIANFLQAIPQPIYDFVVMNPPFYGKHYAKHVNHALRFLKEGGSLHAVLPVTARYDHGLLEGRWFDLPVGSFRESGTNINTTVLTIRKGRDT
jgi:type I restriction-modification system DNA methylase subunit